MKILFFSYAYPNPIHPGLGTFNRTMIAGLTHGHDVHVVSPVAFTDVWKATALGKLPRGLNDPTFQAVANVPAQYCSWYYTPKVCRTQYGHFMRLSVRSTLDRAMRNFQPDIVMSYWTHPDGDVAVKTAHEFGVRAATVVGGSDVLINGRRGGRRDAVMNVLQQADGVITVSEDIKRVLIADGIANEKLHVARRGVDRAVYHAGDKTSARNKLGLPDDRPILISVGRLVDVKGHTHLLQACQRLAVKKISFRCYLLGDGPLRLTLEHQINQLGLAQHVELRGSQSSGQLADWYRAADLSVLASLSEGVPNVLLESIACGTPFVASNVGGIPEIADPLLDRLVKVANPDELADAVIERLFNRGILTEKRRRFEPPSMKESAETLSLILRSIQLGQPLLKATNNVMHETMCEADLSQAELPVRSCPEPSAPAENAIESKAAIYTEFDGDVLGRTGESYQLPVAGPSAAAPPAVTQPTVPPATESSTASAPIISTDATSVPSEDDASIVNDEFSEEEIDLLARTGEEFYYQPNTEVPTSN